MKLLYINGDDYAALTFEEEVGTNKESLKRFIEEMNMKPGNTCTMLNDEYLDVHYLEFKDVDPKFINFIKLNLIDYDHSKNKNFYIVEE